MRSRFLNELTTPDVEKYFALGGKTAILPVGSVEMHGPHQPLGSDMIIAKAFSLRVAELANGLVLPEVHYTWAGATDGFAGTISIDMELESKIVKTIIVKTLKMGFERFVIINVHWPGDHILYLVSRQVFEQMHVPILYVNTTVPFNPDASAIFSGDYKKSKEASLVLASLQILGQADLYSEKEMCYEESVPPYPESFDKLNSIGGVGYFMQDPRQHACPSKYVSKNKGLEFIETQAKHIVPFLEDLDKYKEETDRQNNKGWW
jgi:creatinine amidohydrolase